MAFKSKSLSDLVRVCENELSMQFYGETSVLRKSVLKVLAAVLGGALYMMQLHLVADIVNNLFQGFNTHCCLHIPGHQKIRCLMYQFTDCRTEYTDLFPGIF